MTAEKPPSIWTLVGVGSAMAALVGGGLLLGWYIDDHAHTGHVFVLVGLAVGIITACFYTYFKFRKFW